MYTEQKQKINNVSLCVLDDVIETMAAFSRLNTRFVRSEAMLPILFFTSGRAAFCLIHKLKRFNNR